MNGNLEYNSRTNRNAKLYREICGDDLSNSSSNNIVTEIDEELLKELINGDTKKNNYVKDNQKILEQTKRNFNEEPIYDINEMLKKAKEENNKNSNYNFFNKNIVNKNILSTLTNNELLLEDIKREKIKKEIEEEKKNDSNLEITREIKFEKLQESLNQEEKLHSLMFSSLMDNNLSESEDVKKVKSDIHSSDTTDIDVIKNSDESFFTSSYEFSKKDFSSSEDFYNDDKNGGFLKIILLILAIFVFIGVIVYFVLNYGIGV